MTTLFQLHWAGTQHLRRWLRTEVKALPEVSDSVVSIKDQFLTAQYTGHSSLATLSLYLLNKHCHGLPYTSLTCVCLVRCHRSCTYAGHALLQSDLLLHSNWSLSQNHKKVLPFAPPPPTSKHNVLYTKTTPRCQYILFIISTREPGNETQVPPYFWQSGHRLLLFLFNL